MLAPLIYILLSGGIKKNIEYRISNKEYRSLFEKLFDIRTDFDIRYSLFDIRYSQYAFIGKTIIAIITNYYMIEYFDIEIFCSFFYFIGEFFISFTGF